MHDFISFKNEYEKTHPRSFLEKGWVGGVLGWALFFTLMTISTFFSMRFFGEAGQLSMFTISLMFAGILGVFVGMYRPEQYENRRNAAYVDYLASQPLEEVRARALSIPLQTNDRNQHFEALDKAHKGWSQDFVADLAFLSSSPEVYKENREAVVWYLNKNHEGWSRTFPLANPTH